MSHGTSVPWLIVIIPRISAFKKSPAQPLYDYIKPVTRQVGTLLEGFRSLLPPLLKVGREVCRLPSEPRSRLMLVGFIYAALSHGAGYETAFYNLVLMLILRSRTHQKDVQQT